MSRTRVRAIIECDGKVLLVRNLSSPKFWCLPGGGVEQGEDIITAIHREIIEETGIEPVIGNIVVVHQFASNNTFGFPEFFFHVKNGHDYLGINIDKTTHGKQELAEIGFMDIYDVKILPEFLKKEFPVILKENFLGPTRVRIIG